MKRKLILLLIVLFAYIPSFSVIKSKQDILSVSVNIVAKDESLNMYPNINFEDYFITITLLNTQDSNVQFKIMSCSWAESFITNNDSIIIVGQECDSNVPETIDLKPHQTITFFGKIRSRIKYKYPSPPPVFKIGFVNLPLDKWPFDELFSKNKRKFKTYWSEDLLVENNLNNYKIETQ